MRASNVLMCSRCAHMPSLQNIGANVVSRSTSSPRARRKLREAAHVLQGHPVRLRRRSRRSPRGAHTPRLAPQRPPTTRRTGAGAPARRPSGRGHRRRHPQGLPGRHRGCTLRPSSRSRPGCSGATSASWRLPGSGTGRRASHTRRTTWPTIAPREGAKCWPPPEVCRVLQRRQGARV